MKEFIHIICGQNKNEKKITINNYLFLVGAFIIYFITEPKVEKWIYNLPNNYIIEKESDTKVQLGKYIDNELIFEKDNKQIGIEEYIAEFNYSEDYVSLKCLETTDENIIVKFYIIDTKNEDIYGPYLDEETYNEEKEKIVYQELNGWIETIRMPKDAINK